MRVLAPAKINLHLRVGPPGADGFHPLLSWMVTTSLFDILDFEPAGYGENATPSRDAKGSDRFTLSCSDSRLPTDRRNLVVAAATALADTSELYAQTAKAGSRVGEGTTAQGIGPMRRVSAFLDKRIPSGGGLGGGSSDAASTLLALNRLWELDHSTARLSQIAVTLGSDVPFFLYGPSSVCKGRGEIVRPIAPPTAKFAVLVLPGIEMPTPAVYRRFDEMGSDPETRRGRESAIENEPDWNNWCRLTSSELMPLLVNDLEAPAYSLRPELDELRERLQEEWVCIVRMSGSGSSLFTLCDEGEAAEERATRARARLEGSRVEVVRLAPATEISAAGASEAV